MFTGCLEGLPSTTVGLTQDSTTLKHYKSARLNKNPRLNCAAVALLDLTVEYGRIQGTLLAIAFSIITHYLFATRFNWYNSLFVPTTTCLLISCTYRFGIIPTLVPLVVLLLAAFLAYQPKPERRQASEGQNRPPRSKRGRRSS